MRTNIIRTNDECLAILSRLFNINGEVALMNKWNEVIMKEDLNYKFTTMSKVFFNSVEGMREEFGAMTLGQILANVYNNPHFDQTDKYCTYIREGELVTYNSITSAIDLNGFVNYMLETHKKTIDVHTLIDWAIDLKDQYNDDEPLHKWSDDVADFLDAFLEFNR